MKLEKYSFGIGDRFGLEGGAQLDAIIKARGKGVEVAPVWNKSHREHSIVGTEPGDVRVEADNAVKEKGFEGPYHVDADHIGLSNVDGFIEASDFFTLDIADFIGKNPDSEKVDKFVKDFGKYTPVIEIPGIDEKFEVSEADLRAIAVKFATAISEAGKIYRHILKVKGEGNFITEVSMDETDQAQSPAEMFFILAGISAEGIAAQTIAPKFTGRFNKGVDYVGDVKTFAKEFEEDVLVIKYAIKEFGLCDNLKLSVHSGSDKFSIYEPINLVLKKYDAGLHLKTAGTTWLEEVIGLAAAGGKGLETAKKIYSKALPKFDELCGPYATVIDIDKNKLPSAEEVNEYTSEQFASALRHDPLCADYNPHLRQLIHVGYKIAAGMGDEYLQAVKDCSDVVGKGVMDNIYERHIEPLFIR